MNVSKKASTKIEQILTEEKDILTSKKRSLEKSCSHFFTIQRYLDRCIKKGGDLTEAFHKRTFNGKKLNPLSKAV